MRSAKVKKSHKKWEYSLWVIIVVICCSIPWLVREAYDSGRHYDEWDFTAMLFIVGSVIIIPTISLFAFAVRKSIKNKKLYAYIASAIALALTASFCAYPVGKHVWTNELGENEKIAQNIATLLEAYKTEHGAYPDSLAQIGKGGIVMQRGKCKEELQYEKSNGHFSLSIPYGWYDHIYESHTGQWGWYD